MGLSASNIASVAIFMGVCENGQVRKALRQGGVHWVQARTQEPARKHRSPQSRGLRRQGRCLLVHRQAMRIRLQGKPKIFIPLKVVCKQLYLDETPAFPLK